MWTYKLQKVSFSRKVNPIINSINCITSGLRLNLATLLEKVNYLQKVLAYLGFDIARSISMTTPDGIPTMEAFAILLNSEQRQAIFGIYEKNVSRHCRLLQVLSEKCRFHVVHGSLFQKICSKSKTTRSG